MNAVFYVAAAIAVFFIAVPQIALAGGGGEEEGIPFFRIFFVVFLLWALVSSRNG